MRSAARSLAAAIFSLAGLAAAPLAAQDKSVASAAPAAPVKHFAAGDIRGELLTAPASAALTAGASVFAQIRLSTDVAAKKGVSADVLIEAELGEIVAVIGSGARAGQSGQRMRATIEGLRKGRSRALLVEVKLAGGEGGQARLRITLAPPATATGSASGQSAEVAWSVRDCAGGYYSALQTIRADKGANPGERWKEAAKADPALPKSWLFAPKEERRSRRRPRRSAPEATAAAPGYSERAILAEARRLVRARTDPALERDGSLGWVLGKVSSGLDSYLSQPANPAMCTGATGLVDYYSQRLDGLAKRGEELTRLAADAARLAGAKVETAFRAVRELPEDSPGWSGVTPVAAKAMTVRADGLTSLAVSLAELAAVPPEALARARDAKAPYDALIQLAEAGHERDGMPKAVQDEIRAAFAAIEAAARLETARQRHIAVQGAFEGRLKAIRDAHAAHCTCQS